MIDLFLDYLRYERNKSQLTVRKYEMALQSFEAYFRDMDCSLSWATVDADVIRSWMESMMDNGKQATTVNGYLSAVRSFYRFALMRHLVDKDPAHHVKGPKKQKPLPAYVKEGEMDRLLDTLEWGDSLEDRRDRAILTTFYETGVRVSELVGLDDSDVDFAQGQLKVTGKRNKQRIVPFGQELADELRIYIKVRDEQLPRPDAALFVTLKGTRLNIWQAERIVKRHLTKVTTQKKRTPHVLRHSFATAMLNHDASLEGVKNLLGHESVATTEIYTHTTFEQLKRVYKQAHPRG